LTVDQRDACTIEAAAIPPTAGEEAAETKDAPLHRATNRSNQQKKIYSPTEQQHRRRTPET